jgi:hypothetical protein
MPTLHVRELAEILARETGWDAQQIRTAIAIAMAESGLRTDVLNARAPDYSVGIFQINFRRPDGSIMPRRCVGGVCITPEEARDPVKAARFAYALWRARGDFSPWTAYSSGAYRRYVGRVHTALGDATPSEMRGFGLYQGTQGERLEFGLPSEDPVLAALLKSLAGGDKVSARHYLEVAQSWDIPITPGLRKLARQAVRRSYTASEWLFVLRKTKSYRQRFLGKPGWMSEAEYLNWEGRLRMTMRAYGGKPGLDRKMIGYMIRHGIAPEDLEFRLQVLDRVERFGPALRAFAAETGVAKTARRKDLFNLVVRMSRGEFNDLYEKWSAGVAAARAGVRLKEGKAPKGGAGDLTLDPDTVRRLVEELPGVQSEEDLFPVFRDYAKLAAEVLPAARLYEFGVNKKELLEYAAGAANFRTAQKVERVLAQRAAFFSRMRASPRLATTAEGKTTLVGLAELSGPPGP